MKMRYLVLLATVAALLVLGSSTWLWQMLPGSPAMPALPPAPGGVSVSESDGTSAPPLVESESRPPVSIVADNLAIPWEIAFLPEGSLLVTERPGRLLKIADDRTSIPISGVRHVGEGGLLGLALHPQFSRNSLLYVYVTAPSGRGVVNRVERYRLTGTTLTDRTVILDGIPGASNHDGGRLAFGPDGLLYITTGDADNSASAQDLNSLGGKILRLADDGSIPQGNPFGTAVYSYGHRNPQGLAWDSAGRLWATEHGRSGVRSGFDEINLIEPGKNYGWPEIEGDETASGLTSPVIHSGASTTWAPAGAAIVDSSLFFAGLRGASLYQARLSGESASSLVEHFSGEFGRLRAVVRGPDGALYITTSNTDGRGDVRPGDDKIIRIDPTALAGQ
jgi:glucose/arabinose dehydrogenase